MVAFSDPLGRIDGKMPPPQPPTLYCPDCEFCYSFGGSEAWYKAPHKHGPRTSKKQSISVLPVSKHSDLSGWTHHIHPTPWQFPMFHVVWCFWLKKSYLLHLCFWYSVSRLGLGYVRLVFISRTLLESVVRLFLLLYILNDPLVDRLRTAGDAAMSWIAILARVVSDHQEGLVLKAEDASISISVWSRFAKNTQE